MDNIELIVCVTGAAGHIATALYLLSSLTTIIISYPLLGCGQVFGSHVSIHLKLLDL